MNLPTFLVGLGRPPVEDGLAVDQSTTTTTSLTDSMGYNSYLSDARNAVRAKFEATQCWVYDYDGISPPPFPPKSDSQVSNAIKLFLSLTKRPNMPKPECSRARFFSQLY